VGAHASTLARNDPALLARNDPRCGSGSPFCAVNVGPGGVVAARDTTVTARHGGCSLPFVWILGGSTPGNERPLNGVNFELCSVGVKIPPLPP
jgi:hypothetical protein